MRRGAPILIPGDGTSLEVLTNHRDVAVGLIGLLGNPAAIGEAFHITSDEALTWNRIYADVAAAAGIDGEAFARQVLHVPTDALGAADEGLAREPVGRQVPLDPVRQCEGQGAVPNSPPSSPCLRRGHPARRSRGSRRPPRAGRSTTTSMRSATAWPRSMRGRSARPGRCEASDAYGATKTPRSVTPANGAGNPGGDGPTVGVGSRTTQRSVCRAVQE